MKLNEVFAKKTYRPKLSFSMNPSRTIHVWHTHEEFEEDGEFIEGHVEKLKIDSKDLEDKLANFGEWDSGGREYITHFGGDENAGAIIMNGLGIVGPKPRVPLGHEVTRVAQIAAREKRKAEIARWKGFIEGWYRSLLTDKVKEMPTDFGEVRVWL